MSMEYGEWTDIAPRLQLLNLENNTAERTLAQDVLDGLGGQPKELPPKYFYDEYGSWLFDCICQVPEYYPTRTEDALLQRYARDIIATSKPDTIFELGSGASRKTVHLLNACEEESCFSIYQPLDVCGEMLVDAGQRLTRNYGWLDIEALVGDYRAGLDFAAGLEGSGLYVFLGGSIGNFTHKQAVSFLTGVRRSMSDRDFMLLGADRVKSPSVLNAAYNDSRGYTEAFNLNILSVINRELGGQFNLDQFEHQAFFNEQHSQIEMHLRSTREQNIDIDSLEMQVGFEEGETVLTEISRKFTPESLAELVGEAGFAITRHYQPENGYFSLLLLTPNR
ncbi:MAG: L-histidine N(alpha)-methyltransferase [Acidiferrobacterales bacterium]